MKNTLETDLDRLFNLTDNPTDIECARIIQKHIPKDFSAWPSLLRRLADYIEKYPKPIMLHPKALNDIIQLSLREDNPWK